MHKISITKKAAWSLILKINNECLFKDNRVKINQTVSGKEVEIIYDIKNNNILSSNLIVNDEIYDLFKIFMPIVCSKKKIQYIAHIAQSLDGFIATESGESKYISSKKNLEHIHRLRALSDIIIVGANTYLEDKPKLTTRLVEGNNPKIYIFDPKKIIKRKGLSEKIMLIQEDMSILKKELSSRRKAIIYIEGGGKTISYFMGKNILTKIHICLCPIILGGGRPSFIQQRYTALNKIKSYNPSYYQMDKDILFDINL